MINSNYMSTTSTESNNYIRKIKAILNNEDTGINLKGTMYYEKLVEIYKRNKSYNDIIEISKEILGYKEKLDRNFREKIFYNLGFSYYQLKKYRTSILYYNMSIELSKEIEKDKNSSSN